MIASFEGREAHPPENPRLPFPLPFLVDLGEAELMPLPVPIRPESGSLSLEENVQEIVAGGEIM